MSDLTLTRFNQWLVYQIGMTANRLEKALMTIKDVTYKIAHNLIYTLIYDVYIGCATIEEMQRFETIRQAFA